MIKTLSIIKNFTENKNIVLLGNSRSILINKKNINDFDIVCRINRGKPKDKEEFIGSRTDVLFLATRMTGEVIKQDFEPTYVVWTTECKKLALPWVKENAIQNPPEDWRGLRSKLPSLPSTGCVTINFLLKHINFKSLTIYGFNFFKDGTWYHDLMNQKWHCFKEEEILIKNMIKPFKNIKLIIENKGEYNERT